MVLIKHETGNVSLPKYGIYFPPDKAVEVNNKLAEKVLRNKAFSIAESDGGKKSKKKGGVE